ncbi:MAG: VCBS repeat domain-containing M23 family metallopeptidase [Myxococcales bacterium]|nr:VCBS repeat domain-containing M23 family metallopeptidase [Myxococcales bacterium]
MKLTHVIVCSALLFGAACSGPKGEPVESSNQAAEQILLYYPLDEFFQGVSCDWDCYKNNDGSWHAALDLTTGPGKQTIRAALDGWLDVQANVGGCGNMAVVTHASGYSVKYCHLSTFEGGSRPVRRGDVLGLSGATGWTDPVGFDHVHFQVRDDSGAPVHPGCPPGVAGCNDGVSRSLWAVSKGRVVRASEREHGLDFDGDGCEDIVARRAGDQSLALYRGDCHAAYRSQNQTIGTGFGDFDRLLSVGDWDGDGCADLIGRRRSDSSLRLYAGDCGGGYSRENVLVGTSWGDFELLTSPGDWDGDGCADLVGRRSSDHSLRLYAGDCAGGYLRENVVIGTSWGDFDFVMGAGDWDGDGCSDLVGRRTSDQTLRLYAGDCHSGYSKENELIGTSFGDFDLLVMKDWNGDGCSDLVGRRVSDASLRMYASSCTGGWSSENVLIGTEWGGMDTLL